MNKLVTLRWYQILFSGRRAVLAGDLLAPHEIPRAVFARDLPS